MSDIETVFDYPSLVIRLLRDHDVLLLADPYPDLSTDQAVIEYITKCLHSVPLFATVSADVVSGFADECIAQFTSTLADNLTELSSLKIRVLVILNMILRLLDKQKELATVEIDGDDAVH